MRCSAAGAGNMQIFVGIDDDVDVAVDGAVEW